MAEVLTEVFTGGLEMPLHVKEEQIERIFQLISKGDSEARIELMEALQCVVKVEDLDLPINRNQAFVIKYFSKTQDKFCNHILGESKKLKRWQLLTKSLDSDPDLQLLLTVTDLLASCAEGENLFIESVCQTILKLEELLHITCHPKLPTERKRPFARFLTWVYLNTEANKHLSGASSLSGDSDLWAYLEYLSVLLKNIRITLRSVPDSQHQWVYKTLTIRNRTHSSKKRGKRKAVRTTLRSIEHVTTDSGEFKPGVLLYFVDGVLPLLQSFFANLYSPPDEGKSGRDIQLRVTNSLLSSLTQLCAVLMKYLTKDVQVKLYRRTIAALIHGLTPDLVTDKVKEMIGDFHKITEGSKGTVTSACKLYEAKYCDEIKLNEEFKWFVANYRLVYEGANTVSAQIGVKYSTDAPYSDFTHEEGSVYLPLGPSFQEHVSLFVCHTRGRVPVAPFVHGHGGGCKDELLIPETERLMKQLEISFNKLKDLDDTERRRQDELDLKTLRILRAIVHNRIVYIDPDLQENDPAGYRSHCVAWLHPVQNKLQGFGNIVSRVVPLLSHPNDEIVCEVLAFLKAMLYSGNRTVQRGFRHLLETREERLFTTLSNLLQCAAITYKEIRAMHAQVLSRNATEEAQWRSLFGNRRKSSTPAPDLKVSTTVTIEFPASVGEGESDEEYALLGLMGKKKEEVNGKGEGVLVSEDEKLLVIRDSTPTYTKLALEVLGLMCDNQYRLMQNYLREQKDNIITIDLAGEVALFAQNFFTDINHANMEMLHLILQTLIELCVGNYHNQKVIYNRQIIDVLNAILQHHLEDIANQTDDWIKKAVSLKGSVVELVEAMLEKTSPCTKDLAKEIAGSLDLGSLHRNLDLFYELKDHPVMKRLQLDDDMHRGLFRAYHILVNLQDYGNDLGIWTVPSEEEKDVEVTKAIQYCRSHSLSIEINYENMDGREMVTKVIFPFDPANNVRKEVIEKVKWHINRDSAEEKLRDLLKWTNAIKADTMHQNWIKRHWLTRILVMFPTERYYLLLFLTFLLNLFVIISFSVPQNQRNNATNASWPDAAGAIRPDVHDYFHNYLLYILGGFHLIVTVWMVVEYFVVNYFNFIFPLPAAFYKFSERWGWNEPKKTYSTINIYGVRTVYTVIFLLASILSLAFYGYLYCLCLFYIIVNNDVLLRVLSAVTKHGVSLLWVAVLGGIVLYAYAVISFAFLHESFNDEGEYALYCDTLGQCFISVIRWGLIENLGLVVPLVPQQFETSGLRILFDISFFIIVTTIGLNIVFGIIVDTFSELRNERFHAEQDKKSFCFICNIPKHDLERRGEGFEHHVKREHNMWAYIYYSIYLDSMDANDHNAIQKYVYEMIREKQIKFFPLLQALSLESEEDESAQQLKELRTMVTSVFKRFKDEEHEKSLQFKRQEQEQGGRDVIGGSLPPLFFSTDPELPQTDS